VGKDFHLVEGTQHKKRVDRFIHRLNLLVARTQEENQQFAQRSQFSAQGTCQRITRWWKEDKMRNASIPHFNLLIDDVPRSRFCNSLNAASSVLGKDPVKELYPGASIPHFNLLIDGTYWP
jgi:hypothetical protein